MIKQYNSNKIIIILIIILSNRINTNNTRVLLFNILIKIYNKLQISGLLKFKDSNMINTLTYKTYMNSVKAGTDHSK